MRNRLLQSVVFIIAVAGVLISLQTTANEDPLVNAAKALEERDFDKAFKLLSPLAKNGDARARYWLSAMYLNGDGVTRDPKTALDLLQKSANQGNPQAQTLLGRAHLNGQIGGYQVPKNEAKAEELWLKAAAQGFADAQFMLGELHHMQGNHFEEAVKYWRPAAEQGHPGAQYKLGGMYIFGDGGVKKDLNVAKYWWEKAAAQGHREAEKSLSEYLYPKLHK